MRWIVIAPDGSGREYVLRALDEQGVFNGLAELAVRIGREEQLMVDGGWHSLGAR
jgi:hypothetical protein